MNEPLFNASSRKSLRQKLRSNMPKAEVIVWNCIRRKNIEGFRFRRQHGIGEYVVDFYCSEARLVIEIDGDSHFTNKAKAEDRERTQFITSKGIRVLRFTNEEVYSNVEGVIATIRSALLKKI